MTTTPLHRTTLLRGPITLAIGVLVAVFVWPVLGVMTGLLAGWAALCVGNAVWILAVVWPMDPAETRRHATGSDPGRLIARVIAIMGSVASLAAVAVVLIETQRVQGGKAYILAGIALVAVAASWVLIQLDYMLRIADFYYAEPVGGIDFHQEDDPMYSDFAYIAFGLGMTYQVADTDIVSPPLRRIVLGQTVLAYLFGAVILAAVINLVTNLG
jgi:uncharacterized membrane protein